MKTVTSRHVTPANLFSLLTVPWILLNVWYRRMESGSSKKSDTEEFVVPELERRRGRLADGLLLMSTLGVLRLGEDWTMWRWWTLRLGGGASRSRPVSNDLLSLRSIKCRPPMFDTAPPLLSPEMVMGDVTVLRAWVMANPDLDNNFYQSKQFSELMK